MARTSGDRRAHPRYKVVLDVRWKVVHRKRVLYSGSGLTVDFSSCGVQFDTDEPPSIGRAIEMSIAWPALLDAVVPLRLIVEGRVVRTTRHGVAVEIEHCEFRTAM